VVTSNERLKTKRVRRWETNALNRTKTTQQDNTTMAANDESENGSIDLNDLTDDQMEALSSNPVVQKMLRFENTSIPAVADGMRELTEADEDTDEAEAYDLLVSGIAERSGRVTEATVTKVLNNLVEEYDEVTE
jgi:hypothetical protein